MLRNQLLPIFPPTDGCFAVHPSTIRLLAPPANRGLQAAYDAETIWRYSEEYGDLWAGVNRLRQEQENYLYGLVIQDDAASDLDYAQEELLVT